MTGLSAAVGQWFRPQQQAPLPDIKVGGFYRRSEPGAIIETAKVLHVGPDAVGIPHVRFEILVERSLASPMRFADRRILNLQSFSVEFDQAL